MAVSGFGANGHPLETCRVSKIKFAKIKKKLRERPGEVLQQQCHCQELENRN